MDDDAAASSFDDDGSCVVAVVRVFNLMTSWALILDT